MLATPVRALPGIRVPAVQGRIPVVASGGIADGRGLAGGAARPRGFW